MKKTIATVSLVALLMGATGAFAATNPTGITKTMTTAAGSTAVTKSKSKSKKKGKRKAKHNAKLKTAPASTKPSGK